MDRSELCGCKGVRSCFVCEKEFELTPKVDSASLKVSYNIHYYLFLFYYFDNLIFRNYLLLHTVVTAIYYGLDGMQVNIKTILTIPVYHTV